MPSGGYREGAGRPAGALNKATSEQQARLSELAKAYTHDALLTLVDVAKNGRTEAARVAAANALLDRGYGKPTALQPEAPNIGPQIIELRPAESI